jgi:hypothetical protein
MWHELRAALETKLKAAAKDKTVDDGISGKYKKDVFKGHCQGEAKYLPIEGKDETIKLIPSLYEQNSPSGSQQKVKAIAEKESPKKDDDSSKKDEKKKEASPISVLEPTTIAYAFPVFQCRDDQSFLDALLVFRHSIHMQSIRNPASESKYDYRIYAIMHKDAGEACKKLLTGAGFDVIVKDTQVKRSASLKQKITSWSQVMQAGLIDEKGFLRLFALDLTEPISVLLDMDSLLLKPLDPLFDAMLFKKDSPEGRTARANLPLERANDVLPNEIEAMFTRDYTYIVPDGILPALYQDGFLVARRNKKVLNQLKDIIRDSNYTKPGKTPSKHKTSGWHGSGYIDGGMKGLIAYYFDKVRPNTTVELSSCRFNHIGMDNLYRAPPNFPPKRPLRPWIGKCRSRQPDCEDCTMTNTSLIYVAHYTSPCKFPSLLSFSHHAFGGRLIANSFVFKGQRPWECISEGAVGGNEGTAIDTQTGKLEHCLDLVGEWHKVRSDMESFLKTHTKGDMKPNASGKHKKEIFQGHCKAEGKDKYIPIQPNKKMFSKLLSQMPSFYAAPTAKESATS